MKKIISLICAVIFLILSFTSCSRSSDQQKKFLQKLQNQNQDWILQNFTENEETFNKLVDILIQIYNDKQLYDEKESIELYHSFSSSSEEYYMLRIFENKEVDGKNSLHKNTENFFDYPLSENVAEAELKKMFLENKDYNSNTGIAKNNAKKYSSFFISSKNENELCFSVWSKSINLVYSADGEIMPKYTDYEYIHYKINDNWYIQYYYHDII